MHDLNSTNLPSVAVSVFSVSDTQTQTGIQPKMLVSGTREHWEGFYDSADPSFICATQLANEPSSTAAGQLVCRVYHAQRAEIGSGTTGAAPQTLVSVSPISYSGESQA